jgi:hypothetical protein
MIEVRELGAPYQTELKLSSFFCSSVMNYSLTQCVTAADCIYLFQDVISGIRQSPKGRFSLMVAATCFFVSANSLNMRLHLARGDDNFRTEKVAVIFCFGGIEESSV